jgi:Raf kinase inhibitor-like YbhB/YbcL family protein
MRKLDTLPPHVIVVAAAVLLIGGGALVITAGTSLMARPTPSPTATHTPAPSLTPTPTLVPTFTPTPTSTPTPTQTPTPTPTATPTPLPLALTSTAFDPGGEVPERFGFFRENTSPEIKWENVPQSAQSLALIVDDLNEPFVHWVIYNIPPTVTVLAEGVIGQPRLQDGTMQGLNSNEILGYTGPFPPDGETHRYVFTLYALDAPLSLGPGARREQVVRGMEGHVLATSELFGTYEGVLP